MNRLELRFSALLENVGFARTSVASFISSLNPMIDEVGFELVEQYAIKMHRSLTRIISVIRKR